MKRLAALASLLAMTLGPAAQLAQGDDPDDLAFFEQKIRPVLVKECYSCHSASARKLKGGLRLDSREALRIGGESGPAIVPGKPDESPLIDALKHDGLAMPPKGKLPDAVVADFVRWIAIGAPDPRDKSAPVAARTDIDLEAGRQFWAYKPPVRQPAPAVVDGSWPLSTIDRFILAPLESKGLRPARDADRATLIRRLTFDLIGLPPTPEEIDAFLADRSPDAYETLVDRLLASPHFGERWGRHWLDIVRFGESITLRGQIYKYNWRYRDYVIEALNADMPYDQFLREQIAGDLIPAANLADRRRQRVATTFLVMANTNLEEQDKAQLVMDVVDEQLDTIGKAFLGQTIGCARCHDHKFDPIPTRDYYALAGILRNTRVLEHANLSKPLEIPLPESAEKEADLQRYEQTLAALEARLKGERLRAGPLASLSRGALAAAEVPGIVVDDTQARKVGDWTTSRVTGTYINSGYLHDANSDKGTKTLTFQPDLPETGSYEVWLAYSPFSTRAAAVPVTVMSADGEKTIEVDERAEPPIEGRFVNLGRYQFEKNGQSYVLISNEGTRGVVTADAVVFLPPGRVPAPPGPAEIAKASTLRTLERELKRLKAEAPPRDLVLSVVEEPAITDTKIHIRGSVHTLGETVPRGFLRVAMLGDPPALPSNESGRRELAAWIASEKNPLTARVFVNRAWHWLLGAGLVRTTDNFGTTGETPSHPALLDDLACQFKDDGWSVKRLVRQIVLSRTYRLATSDDPKALAADPENRFLARAHRRRLDAECLRDALLAVAGRLRFEMGGSTFKPDLVSDYGFTDDEPRRSVYLPVFRNALPDLFEVFDFADPSLVVGRRNVSTVAPQALYLMNHPFVIDQARAASRRLLAGPDQSVDDRIERAYRWTLGRAPGDSERQAMQRFLDQDKSLDAEGAWATVFQALFSSIDFRYVN